MARSVSFTISVHDAQKTSGNYDEVSRRLLNAKPAFSEVLDILEEGEARHFARLHKYVRTGALMASLTQPTANDAIREAHGDGLVFGTSTYYAKFLTKERRSRTTGEVTKQKGKSAVLVLQPKAKKAASQVILDFATEPFGDDA
ncbi:MAG: hypothetical protein WKF96_12290 [Solirubrobacteraceae bacterium]